MVVAAHDMPLGTMLGRGDVKLMAYPERGVPKGAILEAKDAVNHALLFPITTNEPVLASKLSSMTGAEGISATIEPGFRAVSVAITDVSGVAGLIQPNSRVDVLFTRTGTLAEASTTTILQNVKVLSTGHTQASGQTADARAPRSPVVTLLLPPADTQKLELAKNQGRLAKTYEGAGRTDAAFEQLLIGNRIKRQLTAYNEAATLSRMDRICQVFTRDFILNRQGPGEASSVPVFVVGMPRSGTTLIEQILSSHPSVFGAGEINWFDQAAGAVGNMLLVRRLFPRGRWPCPPSISARSANRIWTNEGMRSQCLAYSRQNARKFYAAGSHPIGAT